MIQISVTSWFVPLYMNNEWGEMLFEYIHFLICYMMVRQISLFGYRCCCTIPRGINLVFNMCVIEYLYNR